MKLEFGKRTLIMGILNVTPDSFYDGGRYNLTDKALKRAEEILQEGADFIDIGGESTRPGSEPITLEEEMDRVLPVIEKLKGFPIPISIDTYKSKIAEEALKLGATIINDISGLTFDQRMVEVAAKYNSYVVIMHIKGTPKTMQMNPEYQDVVGEIKEFLEKQIDYAVNSGLERAKLIIDPGIGFGKKLEHNLEILKEIDEFKTLRVPIMIGHSRKSMIGHLLDNKPPEERLFGTLAISAYLIQNRIDILRVHDVRPNVELRKVLEAIIQ